MQKISICAFDKMEHIHLFLTTKGKLHEVKYILEINRNRSIESLQGAKCHSEHLSNQL